MFYQAMADAILKRLAMVSPSIKHCVRLCLCFASGTALSCAVGHGQAGQQAGNVNSSQAGLDPTDTFEGPFTRAST